MDSGLLFIIICVFVLLGVLLAIEVCIVFTRYRAESSNEESYSHIVRHLSIAFMVSLGNSLSDMACEDIGKAFHEKDWCKLERYIEEYEGIGWKEE